MKKGSVYSVHPGFAMEEASVARLKERTGRDIGEWVRLTKQSGAATERERIAWLKKEHGISTNYALWIARRADGGGTAESYSPQALVDAMFQKKAALLPVYERLLALALALGKDVKASPGKTIVPLYRKHVFAQIKPSTATSIDLGFALRDRKPEGRLVSTGGFAKGDRITHRIRISSIHEIDTEVEKWLTNAYEMDA